MSRGRVPPESRGRLPSSGLHAPGTSPRTQQGLRRAALTATRPEQRTLRYRFGTIPTAERAPPCLVCGGAGKRYNERTEHRPVDSSNRRAYDDLEIIGSCVCLAYQIDVSRSAFDAVCGRLRAAAERIKRNGEKEGKWRLPDETERNLFDGVYLPSTYTTPSLTVTVYDKPVEIPWGID